MAKTKISEFSSTPSNNTDIDSINIAEGCAPSGINDAIRELMAQLKDFQTGAVGDSFNGPVGTTTAAAGAFTTLSSTGNTTLGDATTDTVTVNGYMGVGGVSPSANVGILARPSALTTTSQIGILGSLTATSAATTLATGVYGEFRTAASAFTVTNGAALYANNTTKGAGSTITNQHGLYVADQTQGTNNYGITSLVSSGTDKWNIYASGTAANYFAGNVLVGDTTSTTSPLSAGSFITASSTTGSELILKNSSGIVTGELVGGVAFGNDDPTSGTPPHYSGIQARSIDSSGTMTLGFYTGLANYEANTPQVLIDASGNMGIGTTTPATMLDVVGSVTLGDASTDTVQVNGYMGVGGAGVSYAGAYVSSSALSGTDQSGIYSYVTGTSAATNSVRGIQARAATAAASFTSTNVAALWTTDAIKGAGSTITNQHGLYIADQTQGTNNYGITSLVSSGTNKWNIYASGTAANYFAGNVGIAGVASLYPLEIKGSNANTLVLRNTTEAVATDVLGLRFATGTSGSVISSSNALGEIAVDITQADPSALKSDLTFSTNAGDSLTEHMRLNSSGNLGLGVTPSGWASNYRVLDFNHGALSQGGTGAGSVIDLNYNCYFNGTNWIYKNSDEASQYRQAGGLHYWYNAPSGTAGATITFTQAMTLDASGNWLLGRTSTSSYRAQITGGTDLVDIVGTDVSFQIHNKTSNVLMMGVGSGDAIAFATGGNTVERMRIDSSGNLQMQAGAVMPYAPAPASISTTATLTNANIQGQIINTTGTSYTVTMPLGTTLETLASWATTSVAYDFYVINTASGTITMAVNTGVTSLGGLTIATGVSAHFRIRRTAANTFVLYRLV